MRTRQVAVLADIHGNMPALEAVLRELDQLRPDEVLVAGDLVGRGPEGNRVVNTIVERGWRCLKGNHEDYLLDFVHRRVPDEWWSENEWAASRWMAAELSPGAITFIDALPGDLRPEAGGFLAVHGSPDSNNDGLGPWTKDDRLTEFLDGIAEALLVCAHTHRPMVRRLQNGHVVNVGSVGLPFNRDRRAQYGLFTQAADGRWSWELRGVDYDTGRLLAVYEKSGFLAEGGVTAALLKLEVQHASPFLVPFLHWSRLLRRKPVSELIAEFLDFYDPNEPLHDFFSRLRTLGSC